MQTLDYAKCLELKKHGFPQSYPTFSIQENGYIQYCPCSVTQESNVRIACPTCDELIDSLGYHHISVQHGDDGWRVSALDKVWKESFASNLTDALYEFWLETHEEVEQCEHS